MTLTDLIRKIAPLGLSAMLYSCGGGEASPLEGKYLWDVAHCQYGTKVPFRDGVGTFALDADEEDAADLEIPVKYQGLTLKFPDKIGLKLRLVEIIERDKMDEDGPGCYSDYNDLYDICDIPRERAIEDDYETSQCILTHSDLYLSELNGAVCGRVPIPDPQDSNDSRMIYSTFFQIRDEPWPGWSDCLDNNAFPWSQCQGETVVREGGAHCPQ